MNRALLETRLLQAQPFTPEQLHLIGRHAEEKTFRAGEYFSEAGRVAQEIGFIVGGVFRVCYFDREGTEITKYFLDEGNFVVDLPSYQFRLPSAEYVQAVTAAEVLVFPARAWQALAATIVDWPRAETALISRALLEKVARLRPLVEENATLRYRGFLTRFPGLANRIPLAYLASYLGITPQSLSRIRRKA